MKQKYLIQKSDDDKKLIIKELAEIDKDIFSILCTETYDLKNMTSAAQKGKDALLSEIRTRNFFPAIQTATQIMEAVVNIIDAEVNETLEIFINDADTLANKEEDLEVIDDLEDDEDQLDDLLEDAVDVYDEKIAIKQINSSINVDDDDVIDDNGDI